MMKSARIFVVGLFVATLVACGRGIDDGFYITGGPALVVSVTNVVTGAAICDARVTIENRSGEVSSSLAGCPYTGDLTGTWDITVERDGFVTQTITGVESTVTYGMPTVVRGAHVSVALVPNS
jgi:hypothetical protein